MDLSKNFQIPPEMATLFKLDDGTEARIDILTLLTVPEKKGELTSLANLTEMEVEGFVNRFFAHSASANSTVKPLKKDAYFNDIVKKAREIVHTLDPVSTNWEHHFVFLAAIKRLKNEASHTAGGVPSSCIEFAKDPEIVVLATAFPDNIFSRMGSLRSYLQSLLT